MNRALVRRVTAAMASMLQHTVGTARVVIGFDARQGSRAFAEDAARVLAGSGHHVLLFEQVVLLKVGPRGWLAQGRRRAHDHRQPQPTDG